MEENKIVIYQTEDGQTQIDVCLENDTVWLTQAQMAELFQKDRTVITRHINNIFKEGELEKEQVCAKIAHTTRHGAIEGKLQIQETIIYNLDVIISVGYRVKSKRGTGFRIWARKVLKDYLIKGYAVNQQIHSKQIAELRQLVQMVGRTIQNQKPESNDENQVLFDIVVDYTYVLDTLDNYDYQRLKLKKLHKKTNFMQLMRMQWRQLRLCVINLVVVLCLVMKKMILSKVLSGRYIRHLEEKNYIPV